MDNKILLQNLAEALAARTGMTKRKAETFVRAFFDLAEEGLTTESILKIKGFATFKIVTVSDRESVNINTGERFQINGHEKISFLPDNAFKELVNRPFNHFTTINLDDDFDISELDSVDGIGTEEGEETEEEQDFVEETETADEVLSDNNDAPTPTDDDRAATASDLKESEPQETADENVGEENPEISEEETNALMNEAQNLIDEAENQQLCYGQETETAEETAESQPQEQDTEEQEPDDSEEEEPLAVGETEGEPAEDTDGNDTRDYATNNEEEEDMQEKAVDGRDNSDNLQEHANDHSQIVIQNTLPAERHNWWRTAFIVLATLVLMTLSYYAGYYRLLCPPCIFTENPSVEEHVTAEKPQSAQSASPKPAEKGAAKSTPATASVKQDNADAGSTTAAEPEKNSKAENKEPQSAYDEFAAKRAEEAKAAKQREAELKCADRYQQMKNGDYLITGVITLHTISVGDNLNKLAKKHYGDKKLSSYIEFHNQISNPDLIQLGEKIEIPRLTPKR